MPPHQRRRGRGAGRSSRPRASGRSGATPPAPPDQAAGTTPTAAAATPRSIPRALMLAVGAVAAVGLVVTGLFVVVRGGGTTATGCDPDPGGWNGAGGGPHQTGLAPGSIHDPKPGWKPSWHYPQASSAASDRVSAPPAAAGGTVYTATDDGTLVALDAATGRQQWSSAPLAGEQGTVQTPIALDGCGAVLSTSFRAASGEPQGVLRAVDLRTHQRRWGLPTADEIFSAPVIVDGVAYAGLSFAVSPGSLDRTHVLDGYYVGDGTRGYRKRFNGAVLAPIASDHQRIWIGDLDQDLYALGPSGRQLWAYTTQGIVSLPAIYDGNNVVVASADHHVASLDPASGREHWNVEVGDVQAAMAEVDGEVVVADSEGTVHALSVSDGSERWHRDLGTAVTRAVVAAGDRVFVVDDDGVLHVLDAGSGAETVSWTAPAPPTGPPAIAAGHLYLTCQDGRIYALPL